MTAASPSGAPPVGTRVFVSYARKDVEAADLLAPILSDCGYDVFIDRKDIAAAEVWRSRLEELILEADAVIFVLSPDAIRSEVCAWEVERTLAHGKKLVPLVWRPVDPRACPPGIADRNWVGAGDAWKREGLAPEALSALRAAIDLDIAWERQRTLWNARAVRWAQAGRPSGQLLRAEEIVEAESWAARRPANAATLPAVLLDYLSASTTRERADRDRLRSITGRAFVTPIVQAIEAHEPDRALRMLATAAVLAEDPDFELVPQLWTEGAQCLQRQPLCVIADKTAPAPQIEARDDSTSLFAVDADGARAALHDRAGAVTLFDLASGAPLWSARVEGAPFGLYLDDGMGVVVLSREGAIVRLDPATGAVAARAHFRREVSAFMIAPEEGALLAGAGSTLLRYEASAGAVRTVAISSGPIMGFDYCPATGAGVALVETGEGKWIGEAFGAGGARRYEQDDDIYQACFSKDGSSLCLAGALDAFVYGWAADVPRARLRHGDKIVVTGASLNAVALSDDGALVLTGSHDGTARVWDAYTGAELNRFDHVEEALIMAAGFGPGAATVLTRGTDNTVRLWSRRSGAEILRLSNRHNVRRVGGHNLGFAEAGLSADGARVWVHMPGGILQLWPAHPFQDAVWSGLEEAGVGDVVAAQALAGGARIGVCSGEGTYHALDSASGARSAGGSIGPIGFKPHHVLALEPFDLLVATQSHASVGVSLSDARPRWQIRHPARVETLAAVPSTGLLAVAGGEYGSGAGGYVDFVSPAGELVGGGATPGWASALCFHRDRRTLLVGDVEGGLYEWEADGRAQRGALAQFPSKIEAIAAPPHGAHLYVAADMFLWRIEADGANRRKIAALSTGVHRMQCDPHDRIMFIEGVYLPFFLDLQRGALLLELPLGGGDIDREEFSACLVAPDWRWFIGFTSKGRRLRRALDGLAEMTESPARGIAAALARGNHIRRASEVLDVLMSEQPDDLASRLAALIR